MTGTGDKRVNANVKALLNIAFDSKNRAKVNHKRPYTFFSAMDEFDVNGKKEAIEFLEFYCDLLENHPARLCFYLSETSTLDWFGRTLQGDHKIMAFLQQQANATYHVFPDVVPVAKIGHRDAHVVHCAERVRKRSKCAEPSLGAVSSETTPPGTSVQRKACVEKGQGDGVHNCESSSALPEKVTGMAAGDGYKMITETVACAPVKFLRAEGHVEFRRPSSKKYLRETKWNRPCKLEIAYSMTDLQDSTIHLIIYSCDMPCKRNLMKQFESVACD